MVRLPTCPTAATGRDALGATNKALAHCSPVLEVVVGGSSNGDHQHVGWVN